MTENDGPATIDPSTLAAQRQRGESHAVVDVRTPGEFEAERLADAVNLPLDVLRRDPQRVAGALDGPAVVVCQSGARAAQAAELLVEAGAPDCRVLDGGMNALTRERHELDVDVLQGRRVWDMERQVRFAAGSLVVTGLALGAAWRPARLVSAFVGGGLVFSGLTNTCGMARVLAKMPWNRRGSLDLDEAVAQLPG
ncbi:DUF2892 domain-containing protein [Egibacter rhizosphaerae]|uniref:DUF2892 domain-containing protein n=2 Tax=Egibacter rhizosphaerae TaxID=1670831 RepID=A0A411YLQ2_9ACTN|nr:DUF2892 domain-containing protein [Egibacter rhizosphaerae]